MADVDVLYEIGTYSREETFYDLVGDTPFIRVVRALAP